MWVCVRERDHARAHDSALELRVSLARQRCECGGVGLGVGVGVGVGVSVGVGVGVGVGVDVGVGVCEREIACVIVRSNCVSLSLARFVSVSVWV